MMTTGAVSAPGRGVSVKSVLLDPSTAGGDFISIYWFPKAVRRVSGRARAHDRAPLGGAGRNGSPLIASGGVPSQGVSTMSRVTAREADGSVRSLLADFEELELRIILLGAFEVPGVSRQKHGGAGVIVREARAILLAEALELARIGSFDPARGVQLRPLEAHGHVVFGANAIGQDVKLKRSDDADHPGRAEVRLEDGCCAFFG